MPQNTTIVIPSRAWTQISNADITAITFQNVGSNHILIVASVGVTTPTTTNGAIRYNPGQGERNASLADLFPGISGRNRVWCWAEDATPVMVSNA
jgi:hypothetical protein